MSETGVALGNGSLYLIGLAAIFLSSKYEDIQPIPLLPLLSKAGHGKYFEDDLLSIERDILSTL